MHAHALPPLAEATPDDFDALTLGAPPEALAVVYFWGPECPNCDVFAAELPALRERLPERVRLVKANAYAHPELAERFGIFGIPCFVLFKGGRKLGMMREYRGKDFFLAVVEEQLAKDLSAPP